MAGEAEKNLPRKALRLKMSLFPIFLPLQMFHFLFVTDAQKSILRK